VRALYIHVPFCVRKCPYCDFYSLAGRDDLFEAYAEALRREAAWARRELGTLALESVYLGGGTPTVLPVGVIAGVLEACAGLFGFPADAEVTCEANPGTVTRAALAELRAAGVNRLSLGVQSLRDAELQFLGRTHTAAQGRRAVHDARDAGFANVSLDLIYCLPGQTPAQWQATVDEAAGLAPSHVSAYCLQIEDGTPLGEQVERGRVTPMPDDDQAALYAMTGERLRAAGFEQYEISNYALPGAECRHNLVYWRNEPYLGLGAGAWSFVNGERRQNAGDVEAYIAGCRADAPPLAYREKCSGASAANETLMMGLRLREGVDLAALAERYGHDLARERGETLARLIDAGLAVVSAGRLALTPAGMAVAGEITASLAFEEE